MDKLAWNYDQFSSDSHSDTDSASVPSRNRTRKRQQRQLPPPPNLATSANISSIPIPIPIPNSSSTTTEEQYLIHIHIPVSTSTLQSFVPTLFSQARLCMISQPIKAALTPIPLENLHISLSRATKVHSRLVPHLTSSLHSCLSTFKQPEQPLVIHSNPLKSYLSADGHRLYIAARVTHCENMIIALIHIVNDVFRKFDLPPHFRDPQPHMSFAYTDVLNIASVFTNNSDNNNNNNSGNNSNILNPKKLCVDFDKVVCHVGKSKYIFNLNNNIKKRKKHS